jgi:hypothetical protein
MTAQEYIISQIDRIIDAFPFLFVKYQNDSFSRTHVIEVLPFNEANSDKDYLSLEEEISLEFMKRYPDYTMYFTNENSVSGIEKIDYQRRGEFYFDKNNIPVNYGLLTSVGQIHSNLLIESLLPQPIALAAYSNNFDANAHSSRLVTVTALKISQKTNLGENTLAMAA